MTMVTLEAASPVSAPDLVDVLSLDQALEELASMDERLCRVVELKFFAGLTIAETAEALDMSSATVERDWAAAKAWLYDRMTPPRPRSRTNCGHLAHESLPAQA